MNVSANMPLEEITQDTAAVLPIDHKGFNSCGLQLQCQNYDYRLFTTVGYGQGDWNLSVRHQYWPELKNNACRTNPSSRSGSSFRTRFIVRVCSSISQRRRR
jgi:hypothetical protein